MGRGRGRGKGQKRTQARDFRTPREDRWEKRPRNDNWSEPCTTNDAFVEYYKEQGICPEAEWEPFMEALRRQLPLTFRINGSGKFADDLRRKLETDFMSGFAAGPIHIAGETVNPPTALPWYPGKLAWQMEFSRTQLRKLPALEALHEFMKRENDVGDITRQEAVSMVPPLFMDVQPEHRVLDMCAAPGSKTIQLLEMLHAGSGEPSGVVVANDADAQRCNMLTHQVQRIRSPALLVTNHEAQNFPLVWDLDPASPDTHILFDRILCDVPCSGDGTLRKQPDIWRRWTASNGNGLHVLQLRITLRACELLRVGGRMVYSTCTFNPVEDEAVVAEVLRRTKGALQLVDVSGELQALRRCPGLRTWRVRDRDNWYSNWEEGKAGYKLDPSMFPDAASDAMPLDRCMRFLPHHQDTGGFFVAVLQKVAPLRGVEYPTLEHRQTAAAAPAEQGAAADADGGGSIAAAVEAAAEGDAPAAELAAPTEVAAAEGEAEAASVDGMQDADQANGAGAAADEVAAPESDSAAGAEAPAAEEGGGKGKEFKHAKGPPPKVLPEWGIRGGGGRNRADGGGGRWRSIDPIVPFTTPELVESIRSFYGLGPECPVPDALIARSEDARPKKLSYVSAGARLLLLTDVREQLKITSAGLKVFERQENKDKLLACCYRVSQEGLPSLLPHFTRQRFQPSVNEFLALLRDRSVGLPHEVKVHLTKRAQEGQASDADAEDVAAAGDAAVVTVEEAAADAEGTDPAAAEQQDATAAHGAAAAVELGQPAAQPKPSGFPKPVHAFTDESSLQQLATTEYGCCVATLRDADSSALGLTPDSAAVGGLAANAPLAISCWRGRGSVNVLVAKQECAQIVERLQAAIAASDKAAS